MTFLNRGAATAALVLAIVIGLLQPLRGQLPVVYKVGVGHRAFLKGDPSYDWRGSANHALDTTIWYPAAASAKEVPQWVDNPPMASARSAAPGAPLPSAPARFPLILLSHGTGGSALMMAWLGTRMAQHGYIAAAVNHPGNNAVDGYSVQGFSLGWERAADLSRVLDGMLADGQFGPRIDRHRIGAAGFSFGGYTMIELAGGVGDIGRALQACRGPHPNPKVCASPLEFPHLVSQALQLAGSDPAYRRALEASAQPHTDARIRAVFAIAPADGWSFSPVSLASIRIPVEMVAGAADPIAPPDDNARYFAAHIPGAKLTIYPGGVAHYTFLDTCTALGRKHDPQICVDNPGVNRTQVHAEAASAAVAFFRRTLAP